MNIAEKCQYLALIFNSISRKISFEDIRASLIGLAQCTGNIHSVKFLFKMTNSSQIDHLGES